jgi:hypothetical protein
MVIKEYRSKYYKEHREEIREQQRQYGVSHRAQWSKRRYDFKKEVILHYGSCCGRCGFSDIRALVLHHKDNDGKKHRQELGVEHKKGGKYSTAQFYKKLKEAGYPEGIIVLCANCHAIEHTGADK